jgi:HK97 gp10 family phage protein
VSVSVQISGLKELDRALGELPKSIAKATLVRTLKKAGEPIAAAARNAAPVAAVNGGQLRDSIAVSARIKNKVGMAEFAAVMKASGGLNISGARAALRDARRAAGPSSFAEMYIGPARGKGVIRYAHLQEFGTVNHPPHPYMRPAWDGQKDYALSIIRRELGNEIIAAARRIGRSKRYGADIKYRASLAALMAFEAG